MARDDDRDAVVAVCPRDRADGRRLTDSTRQCAVAGRRSDWNSLKLGPDAILKRRPRRMQWDCELAPFAAKVFVELRTNRVEHRRVARLELALHRATHPLELSAK